MKIVKVPVELKGSRNLLFDLSAHYDLIQRFGSLTKVIEEIKNESIRSMPIILQAGFTHEEEIPVSDIELLVNLDNIKYLTMLSLQAMMLSLPDPDKYETLEPTSQFEGREIDWDWLYYIGTVLLGMSEAVFWRFTLRNLLAQWKIHRQYNGLDSTTEAPGTPNNPPAWVDQYI